MKKKKAKDKQQVNMPEFSYKEWTPEESRIYDEAIAAFRKAVEAKKTLRQAFESYAIADKELAALIQVDFLKILIAERHFAGQQPLEKVARDLDISLELVMDTHARMIQEAGLTAADQFSKEHGDIMPKTSTND